MIALLLAAASACAPVPGADALWTRPETRIVLVGEPHGTHEAPAFTARLLCLSAASGRPATLALEADPAPNQAAVDAYLASPGAEADRAALLRAPMWADRSARASTAVLDLVEQARRLGAAVALFDPVAARSGGTDGPREQAMAGALAAIAAKGRVIALTGTGHANRTAFSSPTATVPSAIRRLPRESTLGLAPAAAAGEMWSCPRDQPCGPTPIPPRGVVGPPGVHLDRSAREGFDGVYSVGGPFTAAPPAVAAR